MNIKSPISKFDTFKLLLYFILLFIICIKKEISDVVIYILFV